MKTIVLAYHNIGCVGIRALLDNGFEIAAVFTYEDDPEENIWFESVVQLCKEKSLPYYFAKDINAPQWVNFIKTIAPDIVFSFYYRDMVGKEILSLPPLGCLNLHGSFLPKYRGRCPINWAVIQGETETGVTLHLMTPKPDAGDIVAQHRIPILPDDTAKDIHLKAAKASELMLTDILPVILRGCFPRMKQDDALATYFHGRKPNDGRIDWNLPAQTIFNLIRGVTYPYPGAFSFLNGKKLTVWWAHPLQKTCSNAPGTLVSVNPLLVACGEGCMCIESCQLESGDVIPGFELPQQTDIREGDVLE